jgi:ubiquinone/menaquinone biosynthesis C-methylase UbiE
MAHDSSRTDRHKHDRLIHWARFYDVGNRLLGRRGRRMRAMLADDLQLGPGDRVLDVGCGPGRLATIFAERVLPSGSVDGIDPSPEMIKLATTRAQKDGIPISFQVAFAQQLPFPDATFDALSCTLALHHVAEDDQRAAVEEMYRVLKTGGRLLIAEFQKSGRHPHPGPRWLRRTGGQDMINKALDLINAAGFTGAATGRTNLGWLGKITARK